MPEQPDLDGGFAGHIGVEWIGEPAPDRCLGRVTVGPEHLQPYGVVDGGVYPALAEAITSRATYEAVREDGMVAMGQANHATFLRSIAAGHLNAAGRALQQGRTTWVWDVEIDDDEARLCAAVRVTIAVRPAR